ncbi:hypothetical protein UT300012_21610 [Paraclostridium bifermentans]
MNWNEIDYILHLTYTRDDYDNSELREVFEFLGGAVMQYGWVTQKCSKDLDRKHILRIFEKMIDKTYEGTNRGEVKLETIVNYLKNSKDDYKVLEKLQKDIRFSKTMSEFENVIIDFSKKIQEDLKVNNRVSLILSFGFIVFEDYCCLCNDEVIRELSNHFIHFSTIFQYDYLSDGMPVVKSKEHRDSILEEFSKKKKESLIRLECMAKESFMLGETFRDKLNSKDRELLKEYSCFSLQMLASRFNKDDFKELSKLTLKAAEQDTIDCLERVALLYDLVEDTMYDCVMRIANEELPSNFIKKPEEALKKTSKRLLNTCKQDIDKVINISEEILRINITLGKQLSHLSLLSNKHNAKKQARILQNYGIDMAKYWVRHIISEVEDRLEFYVEYANNILVERFRTLVGNDTLEIEQPSGEKIRKSLTYVGKFKELNKIAGVKGFTKVRQNGDHGVFRRFDGSTVVIPQGREIGKGLSIKIQKDLNKEGSFSYAR